MKFTANGVAIDAKSVLGAKQKVSRLMLLDVIKGVGYFKNYVRLYDDNDTHIATYCEICNSWINK